MSIKEKIKTNLAYGKELVESGIEGAEEARKSTLATEEKAHMIHAAAQESWQSATLGAMLGAVVGVLADDRKPARGAVFGGLLGAAAGFGGSFAWKTRPLTQAMARGAGKRITRTRDLHWLADNPINYG